MALDLITAGCICADVMVRPVDALPDKGTLGLIPEMGMHVGGLAGVTAIVYSQLGGKSGFVGRLGTDSFGDFLLARLEQEGVTTENVHRDPSHNSSATVALIDSAGERTFLHHLGTNAEVCESDLDLDYIAQAKVFHWGGPGITPNLAGPVMGRVFKGLQERGVQTAMDTCYDGTGTWGPLIEDCLPHLDIAMTSLEEARFYTGQPDAPSIAAYFIEHGASRVLVKLGEKGLLVREGDTTLQLDAHNVAVMDTTGAGDAACAGFLYGCIHGWDLEQSGRMANAIGALTVTQMGGSEAIGNFEAVQNFMETQACQIQ